MVAVRHCMIMKARRRRTTTLLRFESRHSPAPSLHDIHRPACCIDRDHSIRKRDLLPLGRYLRSTVIAIDARSRRHARLLHCQIGIQIS